MDSDFKSQARQCCSVEYNRLQSRLDRCDIRSRTGDDRHVCYLKAAQKSGGRARKCMAGL